MFGQIINWFRNVRIDLDYQTYENERLLAHKRNADQRFSTLKLDTELDEVQKNIQADADRLFKEEIVTRTTKLSDLQSLRLNTEKNHSLLSKNYKNELNELNSRKRDLISKQTSSKKIINQFYTELAEINELKNEAYEELNENKDAVDSWYARSRRSTYLGGKKGEKLPDHAIFGQSHGDLDSYKYYRDKAYEDTQELLRSAKSIKERIKLNKVNLANINADLDVVSKKIIEVKNCRGRMYELKKQGFSRGRLHAEVGEITKAIIEEQNKLYLVRAARSEHIATNEKNLIVAELKKKIQGVQQSKQAFLQEFYLPNNSEARKKQHRAEWLKQRGIPTEGT